MSNVTETLLLLGGFAIVAVAANQIAGFFQKLRLPFITGLLVIGLFAGPFIFKLLPKGSGANLHFINDISLAFIAFAAAAELYVKELRSRFKSIKWMTFGQLVVTFVFSSIAIFFMADYINFMDGMGTKSKIAVSILMATIFVARSPASAIAVINEMRAKGPFVQTAMGVTVVKDFLVIQQIPLRVFKNIGRSRPHRLHRLLYAYRCLCITGFTTQSNWRSLNSLLYQTDHDDHGLFCRRYTGR